MTSIQPANTVMQSCYENAQKVMQCLFSKKGPINTTVFPTWIGKSDVFWYVKDLKDGKQFRLVDPKKVTNIPAFEHQKLADALAKAANKEVDAINLPFSTIELSLKPLKVRFVAFEKHWEFEAVEGCCTEIPMPQGKGEVVSPNGKQLVFTKDYNLWLRDLESKEEKQLTTDGEKCYIYGAPGTAWGPSMGCGLQVRWSPDSQRIFAVQRDTRQVKALPVMHHVPLGGSVRPQVTFHKFAYPGDEHAETIRLLVIDVATGEHQSACYPQIPVTRNSWGFFSANLGWWHKGSRLAYFVDVDRYYKYARVVEFDTDTGRTKVLFEETSDTQINLMNNGDMHPSHSVLPDTNELLWYSERSGWAHLYLYSLDTGELKNAVTEGEWLVRDVVTCDPERREVFVQTGCRTPGRNPYYRDLVRVNIDSGDMHTLASSDHDYFACAYTDMLGAVVNGLRREAKSRGTSPTGNYSVITRSRANTLPESLVIDRTGKEKLILEKAEIQGLPENWQWPEPVRMIAADGKTDIYGTIYRPSTFSPNKHYPVVNMPCNTPDFPWAPIGSFNNNIFDGQGFYDAAALAELGIIVVQIDGRGGSFRSKAFKDSGYGNLQLPLMQQDQVAGIKQLAERFPFMDLNKVGISAHVGGGQGIVQGLLDYPEFYKVGTSSFVHDARLMTATMWGDMFEGKTRGDQTYPEDRVEFLKGKLLLLGGMLDTTTPPAGIFRIVEALQKSNKDFDMVLLPNLEHNYSGYLVRRSWDYIVQHLLGEQPPKEFCLTGLSGFE